MGRKDGGTSQAVPEHGVSLVTLVIIIGVKCPDKTTKLLNLY